MPIANFSIAIDRPTAPGKEKQTDYPRVTVFGKLAENCDKFLSKGKLVGVSGRIQTGNYEKNGVTTYTTDIIADRVEFLEPKNRGVADIPADETEAPMPDEVPAE